MRLISLANPFWYARLAERFLLHRPYSCARGYFSFRRAKPVAEHLGLASMRIDRFGRHLGKLDVLSGHVGRGLRTILNPVSCVRYFEFDFCLRQLPQSPLLVLDISSPRLLPLYLASQHKNAKFVLLNPDTSDISVTQHYVNILGLQNVELHNCPLDALLDTYQGRFDLVSSVSVIEHIAGEYDDKEGMSLMLKYLKPGGVLALTVPCSENHRHEDEYLPSGSKPYEGTHAVMADDGRLFFQRLYTEDSIYERLLSRKHEGDDVYLEFCGEKEKGVYHRFSRSRLYNVGLDCEVFVNSFAHYQHYAEMPGMGICGIKVMRQ